MAVTATDQTGARPVRAGRRPGRPDWLGTVPFLAYVGIFLLLPTGIVVVNAFRSPSGALNLSSLKLLFGSTERSYFTGSFELCLISSVTRGLARRDPGLRRRVGRPRRHGPPALHRRLRRAGPIRRRDPGVRLPGHDRADRPAAYTRAGSTRSLGASRSSTCYFQIPLMVLVFLPAIDGLKVQWREASESLGASSWQYWRYVGGPLLAPAFFGAALLLFANALSAFATIVAWENQIAYVVPQQIYVAIISEVGLANVHQADVLALGMIVMVAIVMTGYVLLQRRAARWLR